MSIPAGVATVQLSALPSTTGVVVSSTISITPTQDLVWSATGQHIGSMCNVYPAPGWVRLPAVDQAGFTTPDTHTGVTGWSYLVTVTWIEEDGSSHTESGVVQCFRNQTVEYLVGASGVLTAAKEFPIGGIALSGWVDTYAHLPAGLTTTDAGKAYMVQADQRMYVWSGTAWPASGQGFAASGPPGPTGSTGATGPANSLSIGTIVVGSPIGATITGTAPTQTLNLVLPEGHWWTGSGAPGTISAALDGDIYFDNAGTGNLYQLQSGTWVSQGTIKGPTGTTGATGSTGATGTRGTIWNEASGAPGTIAGALSGDLYLDTSGTGNWYKYNGSSWVLQGSLLGPTGATGSAAQWRTGSGVPSSGLGNNGDMYQNTATGDVYGPKTAGAWGSIVANLVGPSAADATTSSKGILQLAGDLGGTAASPTVPGLAAKAPLASPALTGTPTAPTATAGTSTTQIASTAYVATSYAPLASPALTGTPTVPTATGGTSTTQAASTAFVAASFAPLASPTLTGTPAAPTASAGTNTTQVATTAFAATASLNAGGTAAMQASKTANYTAVAGDFVPCSASGGAFTVTLPTAPANGSRVIVMKTDTSTNAVTIARGGTDVFNVASGVTSLLLTGQFSVAILEYASATGIWYNQEAASPCKFTWLVQSGTRATGYGDMPEGIYFDQAATIFAVQFRAGTADASGSNTVALYSNTTNAATGSAVGSGSTTLTATSAGAKTILTGPWSIAAGTFLQVNVTALGTTPGNRLYVDVIGIYL